jgi:hypothetical protein
LKEPKIKQKHAHSPRPSWEEYFIEIAKVVSTRSTCLRRRYGAVIVKDNVIVSTGYNGAPRGSANCVDRGICRRKELNVPAGERYELCEAVHAEQNAIINGILGISTTPWVILLMVIFGRNILNLFVALGAVQWLTMARIVRGQVMSLRAREFVLSVHAMGASPHRVLARHLLPTPSVRSWYMPR